MADPTRAEFLAQLLLALSTAEPDVAIERALAVLAATGIRSVEAEGAAPWLEVRAGARTVTLIAPADHPLAADRMVIGGALELALMRSEEDLALRRAQERAAMLSSASFEGIFVHIDGDVIDANDRVAELLRCSHEEVLGRRTMLECVAPEDLHEVMQRMANRDEGSYVITVIRRDGTRFRGELLSKQGRLGERSVRVVAVRDVTERERTAEMLRESERRLTDLLEAAFDFLVMSRDGVVVEVGGKLERVLGHRREDLVGRPVLDFVAPGARATAARALREEVVGTIESSVVDVHGTEIPVEVVGVESTLQGQRTRVAAFRDLRAQKQIEGERRRLEQHMERAQRLDSLGVLAGGIAHDFNNLLVGVTGNAELLLKSLSDPNERAAAASILGAGRRASDLTRQMLAYAGARDLGEKEPIALDALWQDLRQLLEASLSKKARLSLELEPGSVVIGERATLTQVLMNLLTNASDALNDQAGTIQITARRTRTPDARFARALGTRVGDGDWVLLEVTDDGIGMDAATQDRIFEPFFSTKPSGHGLGLAACLGIVAAHRGAIVVESEPGHGSRFALLLPAAPERAVAPVPDPAPVIMSPRRVLVIDDEPLVRGLVRRLLEGEHHTVCEASGGEAGLQLLAEQAFDVVVLDMNMPDLDGAQVIRRMRAAGSKVPVILCSGDLDPATVKALAGAGVAALLQKPYAIEALLAAIERAVR